MQLVNWLAHIIVFGGKTPYLMLDNLPFNYMNPYGHSMERKAFLLPAPSIALIRSGEAAIVQISADARGPWEEGGGNQPFADFVRSVIAPNETNDRYRGMVSGSIEFHSPSSPGARSWVRDTYYHYLQDGFVVIRCCEIQFLKRLGYFQGNRDETVPPWYA